MREIKFRAWDGTQMHEWGILGEGFYAPPTVPDAKLTNYKTMVHMQYTGLHDRSSGIEVYEGDVVRVYDVERYCICNEWEDCEGEGSQEHKNHGEHKHETPTDCDKYVCTQEVKWSYGSGYFCDEDTGDFCPPLGSDEIELEIIGNIYENPELLLNQEK